MSSFKKISSQTVVKSTELPSEIIAKTDVRYSEETVDDVVVAEAVEEVTKRLHVKATDLPEALANELELGLGSNVKTAAWFLGPKEVLSLFVLI